MSGTKLPYLSDLVSCLPPPVRVLDYGCADQPYRRFFPAGIEYVGADGPELRIITCGGTYDEDARRHLENVIVFAELVGG